MGEVQLHGVTLVKYLIKRFDYSIRAAIRECLDRRQLTFAERNQRSNIQNAYLVEDVSVLEAGKDRQDEFGKLCLQEMLDECEAHGVDNHGKTSAFPKDTGK